jgi:hypothetical protein
MIIRELPILPVINPVQVNTGYMGGVRKIIIDYFKSETTGKAGGLK